MTRTFEQVMTSLPTDRQQKIRTRTRGLIAQKSRSLLNQAIMGAVNPAKSLRTKASAKPRAAKKPKTLAEKIPYFIGCNASDAWPSDTARRHKEYFRASLIQKYSHPPD